MFLVAVLLFGWHFVDNQFVRGDVVFRGLRFEFQFLFGQTRMGCCVFWRVACELLWLLDGF